MMCLFLPEIPDEVKKAICAMAEVSYQEDKKTPGVKSETIDGYSATFALVCRLRFLCSGCLCHFRSLFQLLLQLLNALICIRQKKETG